MSKHKTNKKKLPSDEFDSKVTFVAIVGTTGLPPKYGGWDQLMLHLVCSETCDYKYYVFTCKTNSPRPNIVYKNAELISMPLKANGIQSVPYDCLALIRSAMNYDVILALGSSGCILFPIVRLFGIPIIWNMDGDESGREKWGGFAKLYLKFSKYMGLKFSNHIIADNLELWKDLPVKLHSKTSLIEYGGNNARKVLLGAEVAEKYGLEACKYAFKVCRIEPENNISMILEAFSRLSMKLVVVGNWGRSEFGRSIRKKYSTFSNILMLDPIYDQESLNELRSNCGVYIHGHSVGGTNPSLVEAMNLGLCCCCFDVRFNRETTENKAAFFYDADSLIRLMESLIHDEVRVKLIGVTLLEIAKKRYNWDIIVGKYEKLIVGFSNTKS